MSVRGKFYIAGIELFPGQTGGAVRLQAVSRGARNASWSAATPSGEIKMHISNPDAHEWFVDMLKRRNTPEVFVTFEEAPIADPGDGHKFVAADVPPGDYRSDRCADCECTLDAELTTLDGAKAHPNG